MVIKHLTAKNFLSFEDIAIDFKNIAVAIQGENLDQDDQDSNGSGKSGIFYAIEYALFSNTSKKTLDSSLIRWGCKSAYLLLEIHCNVRKQTLQIERNIGKGKKLSLHEISDDGNRSEIEFANAPDGTKMIFEWLDMSPNDIQNYYLISNRRYTSFMTSPNTDKLNMLSRLTNLEPLKATKAVIDAYTKNIDIEISNINTAISNNDALIDRLQQDIDNEKARDLVNEFNKNKLELEGNVQAIEKKIYNTNALITSKSDKILEIDHELGTISDNIDIATKKASGLKLDDFSSKINGLDSSIEVRTKRKRQVKQQLTDTNTVIQESIDLMGDIKTIISGSVTCPKCKFQFNPSDMQADIEAEQKKLDDITGIIEKLKHNSSLYSTAINGYNSDIECFENDKIKYNSIIKDQEKAISQAEKECSDLAIEASTKSSAKLDILGSIQVLEESIKSYKDQVLDIEKQISNLSVGKIDIERIHNIGRELEAMEDDNVELNSQLLSKVDEKNMYLRWGVNFNIFSGDLARESLSIITNKQNSILSDMHSDLMVRWDGFKLNKDNTRSDKITPIVIRNGIEDSFLSFSGGERGRIEYSSILTNQYLINSVHKYNGLDFLFTDEVAEGVDSTGLMNIVKSLSKLNKTILLTTHVVNQSVSANIMTIRKQHGKSILT